MWGQLTARERRARETLLGLILATGQDPGLKTLASRLEVSDRAAARLVAVLERKGFLVRDQRSNNITVAYPLSTRPTHHRVTLRGRGQRRYALCAIDALGVGPAFGAAVRAHSHCPQCGRAIRVDVTENQVVSVKPPSTLIWYSQPELLTERGPQVNLAEVH